METTDENVKRFSSKSGKNFAGLVLIVIGGVLLARQMGAEVPEWALTWETLVIALGVFIGARRNFRPGPWMIMIFVGSAFLIDEYYNELGIHHYIWPMAIILMGLYIILKPHRFRDRQWKFTESSTTGGSIEVNTVFGGTQKKIVTKEFKGGEVNSVFGGNDLDLTQADFEGTATLEINVVFGGVKLIVPSHWKIQSDVSAAFGSVEDKRRDVGQVADNKTLILKGAVVFGSIEIKSY